MKGKEITIFDVCNKMPEGTISLFYNMAGGKSLGKKHNNNAVIEVLVDNETFQDFAFQHTYGESRSGKNKKFFVLLSVDHVEYEKVLSKIKKQPISP